MMKIEELDTKIVSTIKKAWEGIGDTPASGTNNVVPTNKVKIAQFPAERNSANDSTQDYRVNDLYRNGLLFSAFRYEGRKTTDLRSFRSEHNTLTNYTDSMNKEAVVNILMPRAQSDVDTVSHKFNDVQASLIERGNGSATGALSVMASSAVFGALESVTNGALADSGEQMYTSARSMYAGAENRTKTYTWQLTPRNVYDLIEIIRINEMFTYYSYGQTGRSQAAENLKHDIDAWYKRTFINPNVANDADTSGTIFESITSFLTNVNVVSNPVIWTIKNFGQTSSFDGRSDVFGPAQIQSIRFDKSSDGHFNGLSIAPNLPSSFILEVTFREILTLNQSDLYRDE